MEIVIKFIGSTCVGAALLLDTLSYYKQIIKTIQTKKSSQVSSSSYLYKIAKAICAILGLIIYSNFVGVGMEIFMLLIYIISLIVIARFKPKNWRLFRQ
jgi:uncharacterized protein with PQ loop repeat